MSARLFPPFTDGSSCHDDVGEHEHEPPFALRSLHDSHPQLTFPERTGPKCPGSEISWHRAAD
jgi:hypothetical protein